MKPLNLSNNYALLNEKSLNFYRNFFKLTMSIFY
jgi:hypothetical protein